MMFLHDGWEPDLWRVPALGDDSPLVAYQDAVRYLTRAAFRASGFWTEPANGPSDCVPEGRAFLSMAAEASTYVRVKRGRWDEPHHWLNIAEPPAERVIEPAQIALLDARWWGVRLISSSRDGLKPHAIRAGELDHAIPQPLSEAEWGLGRDRLQSIHEARLRSAGFRGDFDPMQALWFASFAYPGGDIGIGPTGHEVWIPFQRLEKLVADAGAQADAAPNFAALATKHGAKFGEIKRAVLQASLEWAWTNGLGEVTDPDWDAIDPILKRIGVTVDRKDDESGYRLGGSNGIDRGSLKYRSQIRPKVNEALNEIPPKSAS